MESHVVFSENVGHEVFALLLKSESAENCQTICADNDFFLGLLENQASEGHHLEHHLLGSEFSLHVDAERVIDFDSSS